MREREAAGRAAVAAVGALGSGGRERTQWHTVGVRVKVMATAPRTLFLAHPAQPQSPSKTDSKRREQTSDGDAGLARAVECVAGSPHLGGGGGQALLQPS